MLQWQTWPTSGRVNSHLHKAVLILASGQETMKEMKTNKTTKPLPIVSII